MELSVLEDCKAINATLERLYGKHPIVNNANFRLVFSDEQFEKRSGEKSVYCGELYLRKEDGIHEVPKYSYLDAQWVVERLIANHHQDVFEGNYTYEPVYAFPSNMPMPPWKAIEFLIKRLFVVDGVKRTATASEAKMEEEEKMKKAKEHARNLLG